MPEDNEKKGPKLFRPGQIPSDSEKEKDEKQPGAPKLFKPGASTPPSPAQAPSLEPEKPAAPKMFKPTAAPYTPPAKSTAPTPITPPEPEKPAAPKLFRPSVPSPAAAPEPPKTLISLEPIKRDPTPAAAPPMAPKIEPSTPKLFRATPSPVPEPTPTAAPRMAPASAPPSVTPSAAPKLMKAAPPEPTPAPPTQVMPPGLPQAKKTPKPEKPRKRGESAAQGDIAFKEKPKEKERAAKKQASSRSFIREELFAEVDVREMWYKSILAGFLACSSMVFIAYIVYAFNGDSFFNRTNIFSAYSNGNVVNEFVSLWAVTFTPVSSFRYLDPEWLDSWYIHLAPTIFAALLIGMQVRNLKYSFLALIFFVMFAVLIPMAYLIIFPVFELVDPSAVDAGLISAFPAVTRNWSGYLTTIAEGTSSIFFAWCVGGAFELALVAVIFIIPFSIIFTVLHMVFGKHD
jgi:hypothetical protein